MGAAQIALLLVVVATATSADAVTLRATPATVQAVLCGASGGDTVTLSPGQYANIRLSNATFRPALQIDARAATLVGAAFTGVTGVEIVGGEFRLPPPRMAKDGKTSIYEAAIRINGSTMVRVTGARFTGPGGDGSSPEAPFGDGYGVYARNSRQVEVTESRLAGLKTGIVIMAVDGFNISGNRFSGMRSDGINVAESRNGRLHENECRSTRIREGEHPDCIQMWSRSTSAPTSDVSIRLNSIRGHTQGIGLFNHKRNGVDDGGFDRIVIEENDIEVSYPHAIAMTDARDSVVRNNKVRTLSGAKYRASINLLGGHVGRCGNTISAWAGKPPTTDKDC